MRIFWILFLSLVTVLPAAQAYPLRVKTIVGKMSRNNGRQGYKILREVVFETKDDRIKARETWYVKNGDNMKVHVESADANNPWSFEILYKGNKRQTLSSSRKLKTFARSEEFFESLFHDRSSRSLMNRLVAFRFVPEWAKTLPAPDYVDGQTKMQDEPFVRIVPANGTVTYALGSNRNLASEGSSSTTLWVEQDSFLIQKGQLRSKSQFVNEDFQTVPGGLKLPKTQVISWGNRVARVNMLTAEPTPVGPKTLALKPKSTTEIPDNQVIKEFYSRFR